MRVRMLPYGAMRLAGCSADREWPNAALAEESERPLRFIPRYSPELHSLEAAILILMTLACFVPCACLCAWQVDILQEKYGVQFNTMSFSGGGGSYSYRFKTMSTISTKIQFQISFKDM